MSTTATSDPGTLDVITQSFLKIFCDTIFPGSDFSYRKSRMMGERKEHEFAWYPDEKNPDQHKRNHKALWIRISENFLNIEVLEYNDLDNFWDWHEPKYRKVISYRIFEAYKMLTDAGVINPLEIEKLKLLR